MTVAVKEENRLEPVMPIADEQRSVCERAVRAFLAFHNADATRGDFGSFDSYMCERADRTAAAVGRFFAIFPQVNTWGDLAGEPFSVVYNAVADCASSPMRGAEIVKMEPDTSSFDQLQPLLWEMGQRCNLSNSQA